MILKMPRVSLILLYSLIDKFGSFSLHTFPVANHYKTSRESFNDTARHWAQAYAGAPIKAGSTSASNGDTAVAIGGKGVGKPSAAALAGLEEADVKKFVQMGFPENVVVSLGCIVGGSGIQLRGDNDMNFDHRSRY
jgi:hypothetical protein